MTMNDTMKLMFREFVFNEKPEKMIADVNGLALPEDYLAFMQEHDGGEGPLGENNYGRFFKLEELKEINDEGIYCQIDSCNTDEDTYYTISGSLEEFLIRMDEELA